MFRRFYALVSVLLLASLVSAQQDRDYSELEKVALAELKETNTPGATVAIVSGGRAILLGVSFIILAGRKGLIELALVNNLKQGNQL